MRGRFKMASKTYRQNKTTGNWSVEIRQGKKRLFYKAGFEDKEKAKEMASKIFVELDLTDDLQPTNVGVKGMDISENSLVSDTCKLWIIEYTKNKADSTKLKYNLINKLLSEEFNIQWIDLTDEEYKRKLNSLEEKGYKTYIIKRLEGVISRTKKYFNF